MSGSSDINPETRALRLLEVFEAAPDTPVWFHGMVAHALALPGLTADALLSIADVIEEAARHAALLDLPELAADLHRLADLPRGMAPGRAAALDHPED